MNESIFRQKSLDRISSPEEIDNYIRVTRPSLWLALGVIILLLAALILWSVTARIEATMVVDGQTVTAQIAPLAELGGGGVFAGIVSDRVRKAKALWVRRTKCQHPPARWRRCRSSSSWKRWSAARPPWRW